MKLRTNQTAQLAFVGLMASVALTACNTIEGAGRDVSATGNAVSQTAEQVQEDLSAAKAKQDAEAEAKRKAERDAQPNSQPQ